MRICVSGTNSMGKSTLIEDFVKEWPMHKSPEYTYRDIVKDNHTNRTTKDTQWKILNSMIDELQKHGSDDYVVYDRGPLDNIAYTLWAAGKNINDIDDKFVSKCLPLIRETIKLLDIIFFVPITKVATVEYDKEGFEIDKKKGITDEIIREEVDNIFKALKYDWSENSETKFFDPDDKPAIIDVFGQPHERIQMIKWYLDVDGDLIGGEGETPLVTAEDIEQQELLKAEFGIEDSQSEAYKKAKTS